MTMLATANDIQARHREIIRLRVMGLPVDVIAEKVGMVPSTVSAILKNELVQEHIARLQGKRDETAIDARRDLEAIAPSVIEIYRKVIIDDQEVRPQRERMGRDLLDRIGVSRIQKIEGSVRTSHVTLEDLAEIRREAEERRKRKQETTIDAEFTPVGEGNGTTAEQQSKGAELAVDCLINPIPACVYVGRVGSEHEQSPVCNGEAGDGIQQCGSGAADAVRHNSEDAGQD